MPKFYEQKTYQDPLNEGAVSRFSPREFDVAIDELGYDVIWTPAIQVPTAPNEQDVSLDDQNSLGLNYFWANPVELRAIITSIDVSKAYELEGRKDLSMIEVSVKNDYRLAHMDRIIIKSSVIAHSESLKAVKNESGSWIAYSTYPIKRIYGMFRKVLNTQKYDVLVEGVDFTVEYNIIRFDSSFDDLDMIASIRYEGTPVYYMDAINHAARTSKISTKVSIDLPVQGTAMLAHNILELENEAGNLYLNNDFDLSCGLYKGIQSESGKDVFYRTLRYTPTQEIYDNLSTNQKSEMAVIAV